MNDMLKKEAVQNMRKNPCSRARENEYWTEEELERLKTMFDDGEDFTDNRLCSISAGTVKPHIGLAFRRLVLFVQYLQSCFICVQNMLPA